MSLIKCPECAANISDKASSCPHCGYPLESSADTLSVNDIAQTDDSLKDTSIDTKSSNRKSHNKKLIATIAVIVAIAMVACIAVALSNCSSSQSFTKSQSDASRTTTYGGSRNDSNDTSSNAVYLKFLVITDDSCEYDESTGYAKTTGYIKNTSSSSTYYYVKVRQTFYGDGDNSVSDSDWTYAVDSDGLRPGESKKFELMSKQPSINFTYSLEVIEAKMK